MASGQHPNPTIRRFLLQLPNRRRVYEAIVASPGLHGRRMARDLEMALGVVEHHLRQLTKHELVFFHEMGRRRTYYAVGHVEPEDARWIHALRKPNWGALLERLARDEAAVGGLAQQVDLPPQTVSYHLRRLHAAGLVNHVKVGRESVYGLADSPRVARLIAAYHPEAQASVPDACLEGLVQRAQPRLVEH